MESKDDSFDTWLQSVDLIAYKQRLIDIGITSKSAFGGLDTKKEFLDLIKDNITLDKVGHITAFGAAYDTAKLQSATQGGQSNGVIGVNSGANGGQAGQGDSFDAASVYQKVKSQMEMDEINYDGFRKAVAKKSSKDVAIFLKDVSPFNSNGELLTLAKVNALMPYFLDDQRRDNESAINDKVDDIQLSQSRTNARTDARITRNTEQSSQTQSQTQENTQKLTEERKLNRFKYAVGTLCSILFYIGMSAWGIDEHTYDGVVIVEVVAIVILAILFGISEAPVCKNDDNCWAMHQWFNGIIFVFLGFFSRAVTFGSIVDTAAVSCYFAIYLLSTLMITYICVKHKVLGRCRSLRYRDFCVAILIFMRIKRRERDSVSGDTQTENQNDNNYKPVSVVVDNNNSNVTNQQNEKEGENEKHVASDNEHTVSGVATDAPHDPIKAGSQESVQ